MDVAAVRILVEYCAPVNRLRTAVLCAAYIAAGAAGAAEKFPFPLRLQMDAGASETGVDGVPIGAQARSAYEAALGRLGPATREGPVLAVHVASVRGDVAPDLAGVRVSVVHEVALVDPGGVAIDRWTVGGERTVFKDRIAAIADVFGAATEDAVRSFEHALAVSSPVARWMQGFGVHPLTARAQWPERGDLIGFFDAAGGVSSAGSSASPAFSARAGIATRHVMMQAVLSRYSPAFTANPVFGLAVGDGTLETYSLGIEAGLLARVAIVELRAGGGAHWVHGHANLDYQNSSLGPSSHSVSFAYDDAAFSLFAAAQLADIVLSGGSRIRFGIEVRQVFAPPVEFEELRGGTSVAGTAFGLLVGVEVPWSQRRTSP
jgi:hypothetical protein